MKTAKIALGVTSNDEFSAEEINGFVLNLSKELIEDLVKKKNLVLSSKKKKANDLASMTFDWDEEDGNFSESISQKTQDKLNNNESFVLLSSKHKEKEPDFRLEYHEIVIDSYGFYIKAFEKYSGTQWSVIHVSWDELDKMSKALK